MINIWAELLYRANSKPPIMYREQFYALKTRLLEKHGTVTGFVVQHIQKDCWDCNDGWWSETQACYSCDGTGIYKSLWVRLVQYQWGEHTFLIPKERYEQVEKPAQWEEPTLTGYVHHNAILGWKDAQILLFARYLPANQFWRFFSRTSSNQPTPLATFQRWHGSAQDLVNANIYTLKAWWRAVTCEDKRINGRGQIKDITHPYEVSEFFRWIQPHYQESNNRSAPWEDGIPF